jgi:tetratricopeptide (TPR) repeat protein
MRRITYAILVVAVLAGMAFAQDKKQNAPADKNAKPAAAASAAPATPGAKQAKTKDEAAAYNAAKGLTDPAAAEKAADDFAAKFPDSDFKGFLYLRATELYQEKGDSDKTLEMGRKAIQYQPTDPVALAMVASELAERTKETDLDRDERLAEATKDANEALTNIDKAEIPAGMTPEQAAAAKSQLRSAAYSALAMAAYKKKDYKTAEQNFVKAMDAFPNDPDKEYVMLRLTVALDKQGRYPEALEWAKKTQAAANAKPGSPVKDLADQQVARLTALANAPKKAAPAPSSPQPQTVTPK